MRRLLAFRDWNPKPEGVELFEWQAGRCAFCGGRPERGLVLDHDHDTGMTRGYLCGTCNHTEARSMLDEWEEWRDGCNPATIYGESEVYISSWTHRPVVNQPPLTTEQMDRIRAALSSLCGWVYAAAAWADGGGPPKRKKAALPPSLGVGPWCVASGRACHNVLVVRPYLWGS